MICARMKPTLAKAAPRRTVAASEPVGWPGSTLSGLSVGPSCGRAILASLREKWRRRQANASPVPEANAPVSAGPACAPLERAGVPPSSRLAEEQRLVSMVRLPQGHAPVTV